MNSSVLSTRTALSRRSRLFPMALNSQRNQQSDQDTLVPPQLPPQNLLPKTLIALTFCDPLLLVQTVPNPILLFEKLTHSWRKGIHIVYSITWPCLHQLLGQSRIQAICLFSVGADRTMILNLAYVLPLPQGLVKLLNAQVVPRTN